MQVALRLTAARSAGVTGRPEDTGRELTVEPEPTTAAQLLLRAEASHLPHWPSAFPET
jgi:hypothetical protein